MKIILSAFMGKLKSAPMDWPENTPPKVYMMMTVSAPPINYASDLDFQTKTMLKKGTFESTGRWETISGGHETAQIYNLVDIS